VTELPRVIVEEGLMVVLTVGLALFTVNGSQLLVAALLLASLLKVAEKP
jgi:hypothetical protein